MDLIQLLTAQTSDAYGWAKKLVEDIPGEKWDVIPEVLETNITWQLGHLIMSNYFHAILCISGHQKDILNRCH